MKIRGLGNKLQCLMKGIKDYKSDLVICRLIIKIVNLKFEPEESDCKSRTVNLSDILRLSKQIFV
jgi:hypothetical protein